MAAASDSELRGAMKVSDAKARAGSAKRPASMRKTVADIAAAIMALARAVEQPVLRDRPGCSAQRFTNQLATVLHAIKGDETAHARACAGSEQCFI